MWLMLSTKQGKKCAQHYLHCMHLLDVTVRKGKLTPVKPLRQHPEFINAFNAVGRSTMVDEKKFEELEKLTCLLYQASGWSNINMLRHKTFLQRSSVKPGMLLSSQDGPTSPCTDSLRMHAQRANYQALIWYHANKV